MDQKTKQQQKNSLVSQRTFHGNYASEKNYDCSFYALTCMGEGGKGENTVQINHIYENLKVI